jgi:hypothetical protein
LDGILVSDLLLQTDRVFVSNRIRMKDRSKNRCFPRSLLVLGASTLLNRRSGRLSAMIPGREHDEVGNIVLFPERRLVEDLLD